MKENVGTADRIVRSVAGPALMVLGYTRLGGHQGRLAGLAAIVGGWAVAESAITRVCLINGLLGLDTRSRSLAARDRAAVKMEAPAVPLEPPPISGSEPPAEAH